MKFDRRRKYYMILDCETATLPCTANYSGSARQRISIAKPLIYDLGYQIIDNQGRVYKRESFLISEIFSVPAIFNTAYYASKRPIYLEKLRKGEITLTDWKTASTTMVEDMKVVEAVGAYNSMFDYKKALPFTELYINMLYSEDFYKWEARQNKTCEYIASGSQKESNKTFDPDYFTFRGYDYPMFDLWGLSAEHLLDNDEYRQLCHDNDWITASGKYYKTSAETTFRYITGNYDFDEAHTAIEDAEIESQIFTAIHKKSKGKWETGIIYFPFRILGRADI